MNDKETVAALKAEVSDLKRALGEALLMSHKTSRRQDDYDEDEFHVEWLPRVKELAKLAGVDLSKHDPCFMP